MTTGKWEVPIVANASVPPGVAVVVGDGKVQGVLVLPRFIAPEVLAAREHAQPWKDKP